MTPSRRKAREAALRALYQIDIAGTPFRDAILDVRANVELSDDLFAHFEQLISLFNANGDQIDSQIESHLQGWAWPRLAATDRNILRMAATELLFMPEMPPAVTLNEAIEIAKKYGQPESGKFVNGVLAALLATTNKANWLGSDTPEEAPDSLEPESPTEEVTPEQAHEAKQTFWRLRKED